MTYTYSKQIEQWGWNDLQKEIMQRGLYTWDRPHRFTAGLVYQLPFGQGQKLLNVKNGFLSKIVSGWQSSLIFQWQSGRPWDLNDNTEWINPDAYLKNIQWKGSDQVWAFRTYPVIDPKTGQPTGRSAVCAGFRANDGSIQLQSYSQNLQGCTVANVDVVRKASYEPRFTSYRSSTVRLYSPPSADLSFNKMFKITETKKFQFRLEMFNFTNTYSYRVQQFNNDPNNSNFGSVVPRTAGDTEVAYPRHIQLGFKFIF